MANKKDSLGDRMKTKYENVTRTYLPRRTYVIIRLDGKAFHSYTKDCERPFDKVFSDAMDMTSKYLCENIQGCKFAYVQSDEISLVLTDFESITTQSWFDSNLQKMCSISAALATAKFNQIRFEQTGKSTLAMFDSRVFTIADKQEVINYIIWRQQDATRNSISMAAQSVFSHKELNKKSTADMQEMLFQKGINWNDYSVRFKHGGFIDKVSYEEKGAQRLRWEPIDMPIITQDRGFIGSRLPGGLFTEEQVREIFDEFVSEIGIPDGVNGQDVITWLNNKFY
jgi:tRNA(His) 5'-end guanylyltransferase